MTIAEMLIALAPHVAELVENALADDYDQEAEKQALLNIQRAIAEARFAAALKK